MRTHIVAMIASVVAACAMLNSVSAAENVPATGPAIRLVNYKDGEVIRFPVPLIRGVLSDPARMSVQIINTSSARPTRQMTGLAYKGRFKAMTELVPGANKLIIRSGRDELPLTLVYKPQTTPYFVRIVYLTDSSGNAEYQTPVEKDAQDYVGKLDTAMKIMQTFTAERNDDLGFGRTTFNLELDDNGKVKVHVFKQPEPASFYYGMNDVAWWGRVAGELEKAFPMRYAKNVAIASYTRLDGATGKLSGHTALGGGALALFGSGNLFTWPSRLEDVQAAFMDTRPIDPKKFFSDSVGRHTFWGAASTTIGATLHEMSHTVGLPHTREPYDIMTRGFDHFNRAFTFVDAPHAGNRKAVEFKDDEVACFAPISVAALVANRWLAMDARPFRDDAQISVQLDAQKTNILVESESALRYVGFDMQGDGVYHIVPPNGSRQMRIGLADLRQRLKSDDFVVRIIDDQGNYRQQGGLLVGPCVQTWQFATITQPWTDKSALVSMSDEMLKRIEALAASAKRVRSASRFVDFASHFPADKRADVAGYAFREITCDQARRVKIMTGSDDALRIWVNGKLVTQVLALRAAQMDSESNVAEFQAGKNSLMVEVSQGDGDWGLYLRLEDVDGRKLRVRESGELVEAR